MSRDPVLATEYKHIPRLPLAITAGVLALAALIYTISLSINPNPTINDASPTPRTQNNTATSVTPTPHPTFSIPTTYPTLSEEQHQELISELEKLNPPQEALDEIRGYPFPEN